MAERDPNREDLLDAERRGRGPNGQDRPDGQPGREERDEKRPSRGKRILKGILYVLGGLVGFVVTLVLVVLLLLQTDWGRHYALDLVLERLNAAFDGAELTAEGIEGNVVGRIALYDVNLVKDDGERLAHADTLAANYNLFGLFQNRLLLRNIDLFGPIIRMEQGPDGTWDLLNVVARDDSVAVDTTTFFSTLVIELDRLDLRNGSLEAVFYPPEADSVLRIEELTLDAGNVEFHDFLAIEVNALEGRVGPPGVDYWVDVAAQGTLTDRQLALDGLRITSPRSELVAEGEVRLPEGAEDLSDLDFRLEAEPLAFDDIRPFVPGLEAQGTVALDLRLTGSGRLLAVDAAAAFSEGGALSAEGVVTPGGEGPLEYRLEGSLSSLDVAALGGPDALAPVSGTFEVDLQGTDLNALGGDVQAALAPFRYGDYQVDGTTFAADFEDGRARFELETGLQGSRLTAQGIARPFAEIPTYNARGRFSSIDLGKFTEGENQQSDISGTFQVQGSGFDPQTANLTADLTILPSTVNQTRIENAQLDLQLRDGLLGADVRFLLPEGALFARGEVELGTDPLRYRVEQGRFENFDLAALTGNEDVESALTGTFELTGRGTDPQSLSLEASFNLAESFYGTYRFEDVRLQTTLRGGQLAFTADVDLGPGGQIDLTAEGRPFAATPTLRVTEGRFENVDLGALTDDPDLQTDLTGTTAFTLTGFDLTRAQLDGNVELAPSRVNEQPIEAARFDLGLARGQLTFDGRLQLPEGGVQLAGTAQPFLETPTYEITEGRFERLDLGALLGRPDLQTELTGTFAFAGQGFEPAGLDFEGRFGLSISRINALPIDTAWVDLDLQQGFLTYEAFLDYPDGEALLAGTAQPFGAVPEYTVREGSFQNLDVGALLGQPDLETSLTGTLALEGRGTDPEELNLEALLVLESSLINAAELQDGRLQAELVDGLAAFQTTLTFAEGRAQIQGVARPFAERPTYEASGEIVDVDFGRLTGRDTLAAGGSLRFDVEGAGFDPETMALRGEVYADDARYGDIAVDLLAADFVLNEGLLTLDTLGLRSNVADLTGNGQIALFDPDVLYASDFRFEAEIKEIDPIRPFLDAEVLSVGQGSIEGRVFGRPGIVRFDLETDISSFAYNEIRLAGLEGRIRGELGPERELRLGEGTVELDYFSIPNLVIQGGTLEASYDGDELAFQGEVAVDARRDAQFSGRADLRPGAEQITLENLSLRFDGTQWELLQEATITYGDAYRVSNFLLFTEDQQIAIDGVVDPDGMQNLVVTVENVQLGAFADLLGYDGLDGQITGSVDLTGPAYAPDLQGTLYTDLISFEEPVGELRLDLRYEDLRLFLEGLLTHRDGSTLTLDGYIPMDLSLGPAGPEAEGAGIAVTAGAAAPESEVNLTLDADAFSVDWIEPFLPPQNVSEFAGALSGEVLIRGTLERPMLEGTFSLNDGLVRLPQLGLAYQDIRAQAVLEGSTILLERAVLHSGGGTLTAEGTINLAELTLGEFDIDVLLSEFRAIETDDYRATVSGSLDLIGTTERPVLTGGIEVLSADIYLENAIDTEIEPVELTQRDLAMLEESFGYRVTEADTTTFDFYQAMAMDLDVEIERDTWIRQRANPELAIQFAGRLDLQKAAYQDIQIFGDIGVIPQRSYIDQFGRRFQIASGELLFNGDPTNTLMDVQARYEVRARQSTEPQVVITLTLEGRLDELELELSSIPEMPMADVVSYIATGRPAGQSLQLGVGTELAINQLAGAVEGLAGEELGLDVVQIQYDVQTNTTDLLAGKYVSPRLFVGVSQPLALGTAGTTTEENLSGTQITAEYEIYDWLLLRLTGGRQQLQLNLLWEYAY